MQFWYIWWDLGGLQVCVCWMSCKIKNGPGFRPLNPTSPYLFHVKDDNELQGCNCRKKGWEKGSNPTNGLPINDPQNIIRDGKFLLSPALKKLPGGTVGHQDPANEQDSLPPGLPASAKAENNIHTIRAVSMHTSHAKC